MGFFANFVNGAMNAGFNIAEGAANSAISAHYNKALMAYQSRINRKDHKWSLENSPTFQRQGLVDAGYNPILAFSQSTPSMGHVGLGSSSLGSPSAGKAFMESQQLDNAKNQLKIQHEFNKNLIATQKAEIENKKAQTQILKAEADEKKRSNEVNEGISTHRAYNESDKIRYDFLKTLSDAYLQYRSQSSLKTSGKGGIPGLGNVTFEKSYFPDESDDFVSFISEMLRNYGYTPTPKSSIFQMAPGFRELLPESLQPLSPRESASWPDFLGRVIAPYYVFQLFRKTLEKDSDKDSSKKDGKEKR